MYIIVYIIMFIVILDMQLCVQQLQNDSVRYETPTQREMIFSTKIAFTKSELTS